MLFSIEGEVHGPDFGGQLVAQEGALPDLPRSENAQDRPQPAPLQEHIHQVTRSLVRHNRSLLPKCRRFVHELAELAGTCCSGFDLERHYFLMYVSTSPSHPPRSSSAANGARRGHEGA